jgi:hypothetical protein
MSDGLRSPKKKLPIKITDVDCVHVNNVNILESCQGQIGENFTSQTTCTNNKDFALIPQEVLDLRRRSQG